MTAPRASSSSSSLANEKIIVIGANGKTGRRCVEYLRASTDASEIVACTRGGAYEGGAVDERVESAAVNVATASVAELTNAFAGAKGVIFAASQSQSGGDASRVDRDGVISCARACLRAGVERFVIVSSGSVSKPSSPVYVFLNFFGGIMRNKILGEDAVRALYFDRDGQYYTVVRPGGLSEDPARGPSALELNQGDEVSGRVSLYSNLPDCLRGMNGINPIVYGDRTGGTWDFHRMSHDSSFGGTRME
jgi:nucleoside-diphosphate-sugar epimerase